jgi:hypothetical protein
VKPERPADEMLAAQAKLVGERRGAIERARSLLAEHAEHVPAAKLPPATQAK